jgi:hypothetical protein
MWFFSIGSWRRYRQWNEAKITQCYSRNYKRMSASSPKGWVCEDLEKVHGGAINSCVTDFSGLEC